MTLNVLRFVLLGLLALLALPLQSLAPSPSLFVDSRFNPPAAPLDDGATRKAALARYIAGTYNKSFSYAHSLVHVTFEVANRYALPPVLLLAMMAQESSFDSTAYNPYGAMGLMQIVPRFHLNRLAKGETTLSLYEPPTNIRVAASILSEYLKRAGSLTGALRKYSGDSRSYSERVFTHWRKLEAASAPQPA